MAKRILGSSRAKLINLAFFLVCVAILAFLLAAPEETTTPLPHDDIHEPFHAIADRKEAEASCLTCHGEDGEVPLPADHPPPFRCLFCHKRN